MTMRPWTFGATVAVATFAVDQASKAWIIHALAGQTIVTVLPVFDLRLAWNTGISYSLLSTDGLFGRASLVAVALVVVAALTIWLARVQKNVTAAALGLLIGAALGNALDRAVYGAVTDFLHVHWRGFAPFGVFNFADVAITAGVLLLLIEAFFVGEKTTVEGFDANGSSGQIDSVNKLP